MTKLYHYKGKIIGVVRGLGESWIIAWRTANGSHRVKAAALPSCTSKKQAQQNLDAWAARKNLREATFGEAFEAMKIRKEAAHA